MPSKTQEPSFHTMKKPMPILHTSHCGEEMHLPGSPSHRHLSASLALCLGFILAASGAAHCEADDTKPPKQPNFVFVLVDDLPFDAVGFSGRYPFLKTPNIDRLAKEGVNFENFNCTQSICSPSRASFLTGTYAHIHGVNQNNKHVDPDWKNFPSYTHYLQQAGYETAHIGKIHMAHRSGTAHIRPGFDYWLSFNGQGEYFDPMINDNGKEERIEGYITDILTEKAVDWLKTKRTKDKPFSLNLCHKGVHENHSPAPRHENLFAEDKLPRPPHGMDKETFKGKPEWQRIKAAALMRKEYIPAPSIPAKVWPFKEQKFMDLLRCLVSIDESLGKVLAVLDEIGELENTVVIFSSDNGYFMGEHGYWDKRIAYESSMKIPLVIRYPHLIKAGSTVPAICLNIDLVPTILDLASLPIPSQVQGESMVKLLRDGSDPAWRKSMLYQYFVDDEYPKAGPNMVAIKTDRYKLVDNFRKGDIDELYDLVADPGEMANLIGNKDMAVTRESLCKELEQLKVKYKYNPDRDWWLRQVAPGKQKTNKIKEQ